MNKSPLGMLGNFSPFRAPGSGSGLNGSRLPFGHLGISGKAGDVKYVSVTDLVSVNNPGVMVNAQAVGGAVAIALTLAQADLALNPIQNGSGIWVDSTAVAPGSIVQLPFLATALRITFTADAIVYLMGV